MINVHNIVHQTTSEGPGVRCCIWLQGCSIHCEGCFLKDTWSFAERNMLHPSDFINGILPTEEGITICGGEPFDQKEGLAELVRLASEKGLSTVVYTGNTIEYLQALHDQQVDYILSKIDILIDGPFISSLSTSKIPLLGSTNQRILFLSDRYTKKDIQTNRLEIRIKKNGAMSVNGLADYRQILKLIYK